ncbi:hypothetical protein MIND_01019900 [Mycena indigotica]|uniref:JmjC domain-containing protein n=1 Tax=Mycena indigotica TaxID=2126181 RepID=A0A8H6SBI4_9AGAR|nr:uncharacterized protein MIND_01019900 [Mycena indigotica]KAF7294820.1 hypothetical protein MIND_01019900 [Mycena indigotica]
MANTTTPPLSTSTSTSNSPGVAPYPESPSPSPLSPEMFGRGRRSPSPVPTPIALKSQASIASSKASSSSGSSSGNRRRPGGGEASVSASVSQSSESEYGGLAYADSTDYEDGEESAPSVGSGGPAESVAKTSTSGSARSESPARRFRSPSSDSGSDYGDGAPPAVVPAPTPRAGHSRKGSRESAVSMRKVSQEKDVSRGRSPAPARRAAGGKKPKVCLRCEKTIEDGKWVAMDEGGVLCERCWKNLYLPKCRRCNLPIEKQAVSSSDGQLKGKYHRECFNCHVCNKPFPDKTFYVHDHKPMCAYHYHEANDSLCAAGTCGAPIEGPCAVSHAGDRYHPEHMLCEYPGAAGCRERLAEYWEVDGRMLCERHSRVREEEGGGGWKQSARAMKRTTRTVDGVYLAPYPFLPSSSLRRGEYQQQMESQRKRLMAKNATWGGAGGPGPAEASSSSSSKAGTTHIDELIARPAAQRVVPSSSAAASASASYDAAATAAWTLDGLLKAGGNFRAVRRVRWAADVWAQPMFSSGEPVWDWGVDWLAGEGVTGPVTVRDVARREDRAMRLKEVVRQARAGDGAGLYANDVPCPAAYARFLRDADVVPRAMAPGPGGADLLGHLPASARVETLMCYVGAGGTFTPAHKDLCGSQGHNLMTYAEDGGRAFWFMTASASAPQVEEYFHSVLKHDIDHETYVVSLVELARAPFDVFVAEQRVGDLVLVPPRSAHQVVNAGGLAVKTSWSRMSIEGLTAALRWELPLYRRVCRPETYRVKATLYHALRATTAQVAAAPTAKAGPVTVLLKLLHLFDAVLVDEYTQPADGVALLGGAGEGEVWLACDFCGADVFQAAFECGTCGDGEPGDRPGPGPGFVCRRFKELREARQAGIAALARFSRPSLRAFKDLVAPKQGLMQAALVLHRRRVLLAAAAAADRDRRCSAAAGGHAAGADAVLACGTCHTDTCLAHLLHARGVHAADALLAPADAAHALHFGAGAGSGSTSTSGAGAYAAGVAKLRAAAARAQGVPDAGVQRAWLARTYGACRPVRARGWAPGFYDLHVEAEAAEAAEISDRPRGGPTDGTRAHTHTHTQAPRMRVLMECVELPPVRYTKKTTATTVAAARLFEDEDDEEEEEEVDEIDSDSASASASASDSAGGKRPAAATKTGTATAVPASARIAATAAAAPAAVPLPGIAGSKKSKATAPGQAPGSTAPPATATASTTATATAPPPTAKKPTAPPPPLPKKSTAPVPKKPTALAAPQNLKKRDLAPAASGSASKAVAPSSSSSSSGSTPALAPPSPLQLQLHPDPPSLPPLPPPAPAARPKPKPTPAPPPARNREVTTIDSDSMPSSSPPRAPPKPAARPKQPPVPLSQLRFQKKGAGASTSIATSVADAYNAAGTQNDVRRGAGARDAAAASGRGREKEKRRRNARVAPPSESSSSSSSSEEEEEEERPVKRKRALPTPTPTPARSVRRRVSFERPAIPSPEDVEMNDGESATMMQDQIADLKGQIEELTRRPASRSGAGAGAGPASAHGNNEMQAQLEDLRRAVDGLVRQQQAQAPAQTIDMQQLQQLMMQVAQPPPPQPRESDTVRAMADLLKAALQMQIQMQLRLPQPWQAQGHGQAQGQGGGQRRRGPNLIRAAYDNSEGWEEHYNGNNTRPHHYRPYPHPYTYTHRPSGPTPGHHRRAPAGTGTWRDGPSGFDADPPPPPATGANATLARASWDRPRFEQYDPGHDYHHYHQPEPGPEPAVSVSAEGSENGSEAARRKRRFTRWGPEVPPAGSGSKAVAAQQPPVTPEPATEPAPPPPPPPSPPPPPKPKIIKHKIALNPNTIATSHTQDWEDDYNLNKDV